jgi:hypothetical protein
MTSSLQSFRFVSNQSETIKLLITLTKMPVVSSFHGFPGVGPANFKLTAGSEFKITRPPPPENDETMKRPSFCCEISMA